MEQNVTTSITKGVILGLILIVMGIAIYYLKIENPYVQWLTSLILVIGVIISILQYGKQINYNSTFGNYFSHGFKVAAMVTLITVIYLIIFLTLFPDIKEKAIDTARKQMEAKNNMTQAQIDKAIDLTTKFFMAFAVGFSLIGNLILGAIGALIGAAITKKHPITLQEEHLNQIGS